MKDTFSGEKPVAIITGATSGIGDAYAHKLASEGWDLVLIDQRADHMENDAAEFSSKYGTACKIITAELADSTVLVSLEKEIQTIARVDMLINDAGFWMPGSYEETEPFAIEDMIRVHNIVPARLIRAVLPLMLEKNSGSIINVSSLSALINLPHNENYSATKAYLVTLSETLKATLYNTQIRVQVLLPGLPFGDIRKIGNKAEASGIMMPEDIVNYSLKHLKNPNKVICIPNWRSRFHLWRLRHLPRSRYYRKMYLLGERLRKEWGV